MNLTLLAQAKRDLAWLIDSPDLLNPSSEYPLAIWPNSADRFPLLAIESTEFLNVVQKPPRRLGRYAEQLLAISLQNHPAIQLLGVNLAVRSAMDNGMAGTQTLGEFDFLWQDRQNNELHHWELATKFYLFAPLDIDTEKPKHWANQLVGPNLADRLGDKLQKTQQYQLRLAQTPAGKKTLDQHFGILHEVELDKTWHSALYLKAWVFYPQTPCVAAEVKRSSINTMLNTKHYAGWWCDGNRFSQSAQPNSETSCWLKLPRSRWLSRALYTEEDFQLQKHTEGASDWNLWLEKLLEQVNLSRIVPVLSANGVATERNRERPAEPVMVVNLQKDFKGQWIEQSRGFVVPDHWLTQAQKFVLEA